MEGLDTRKKQKIEMLEKELVMPGERGIAKNIKRVVQNEMWRWMTLWKGMEEMNTKGK